MNYLAQFLQMTEIHAKKDFGHIEPQPAPAKQEIMDFVKLLFDFGSGYGGKLENSVFLNAH